MALQDVFAPEEKSLQMVDNPNLILCKHIRWPYIISFHDNGILQIYNAQDVRIPFNQFAKFTIDCLPKNQRPIARSNDIRRQVPKTSSSYF
jgi:hypothetical protein